LRTPLASLLRLAEALSGAEAVPAPQRRQAGMVGAAARHLLALANEVLDLAALEAERLTLHPEPCAPAELVADAIAMIGPVAEAKGVTLRHEAGSLPPLAQLDGTRVRQILLNLLSNAVKFTPAGSEVHVTSAAEGDRLRVQVRDQGPGVPEVQRALLFREFSRLHPREAEGTGLGLAISARLAALMGGELRCLPAPAGSCFEAVFPLPEAVPAPPAAAPARLSVLAVDDSAANLAVLRALLANTGFALETVTEGEAALEILVEAARAGRPFDLVLMDVMMPGMDGMEATRRIRALPGMLGRVPVIAVTASAFPEDVAACRAAGMTGHVAKPVAREALLRAIAAVVAGPGSEAPGEAESLQALRPVFLAELAKRVAQLQAALEGGGPLIEPVHAIAGTVGHLDAAEVAELARRALRGLRDGAPEGPSLARDLVSRLARAFPELREGRTRAA
jgi:CheY-like chemotaxis protein